MSSDPPPRDDLQPLLDKLGIPGARRHIFLCCEVSKPKCCAPEVSAASWEHLKRRLKDLSLSEQGGIQRTRANCLRLCTRGPVAVVYPEGTWYGNCTPEVLDQIVDRHLANGEVVAEHVIHDEPLRGGAAGA
jgi:(2Fe-2S) ferredoxin